MRHPWSVPVLLALASTGDHRAGESLLLSEAAAGNTHGMVESRQVKEHSRPRPRPAIGVCGREGHTMLGTEVIKAVGKLQLPKKIKHVEPSLRRRPSGATMVRDWWIGEVLIDVRGHIAQVWTFNQPEVEPPMAGVTEAIVSAVRQWEFEPLIVGGAPKPFCRTLALKPIGSDGRPYAALITIPFSQPCQRELA